MIPHRYFSLFMLPALLTGCVHSGCSPDACKRPDSSDRDLVIWWPLEMRQGLDERDHQIDFTVVPLKD
ncbi:MULTISPECIES: HrpT family type III secretion system protein [Pseudomonas]|uniref:Type III secretion protein n=1 Tax=Pseudomonas wuhanensis TaxID=2954098 RepID=A0ABY9GL93_9PSED|nr:MULTISPECIES: HrpT family type III secretion system protein [unclassified Pseudomonas]WLI10716.1 type III secretion protein [Pseudomonas sp. FP603]WLI16532.1 type III secretion protein [Pseudomonas sp. FP607]